MCDNMRQGVCDARVDARLPQHLIDRLDEEAEASKVKRSEVIRRILTAHYGEVSE